MLAQETIVTFFLPAKDLLDRLMRRTSFDTSPNNGKLKIMITYCRERVIAHGVIKYHAPRPRQAEP